MPERILDPVCLFNHIVYYQPTVMEKGQSRKWPLSGIYYSDIGNIDCFATKNRLERTPINFRCRQPLPYNCDFDMFELKRALSSANNTSPGPDGISYELLRHLNEDSFVSLLYLFNRIWREQVSPTQWQEAIVIPILKPGKDPKNPFSYRPIALTSCLCKTLERVVNAHLVYQLEKNKSIPLFQSGFRASLYVDDLQISCEGSDMRMIERQLQTAVNNIVKWCDCNGHSISASKSSCVHFCRKRGIHPDSEIRIRDVQIPVVPDVRFLGVIFDRRLTFLPHILHLRKSESTVAPVGFQRVFAYHRCQYRMFSAICTDGSKCAGYVGCGVVVEDVTHGYRLEPSCSVFTAEAVAIYRALQSIDSNMPRKYCIYTDSMSVLEALENYNDRCHPVVCKILDITSRLYSKGFHTVFCWLPSHVGIIGNEQADSTARSATTHLPLAVPLSDMKRVIMHHIFKLWQESWSHQLDNKLHSVKSVIGAWPVMPMRRTDVKLTRLRIGHTRLTHRHLLFGEHAPECPSCDVSYTVHHILIDCPVFNTYRITFFRKSVLTLSDLKALQGIGGDPKSVKKLRSGDLLKETISALQTKSFLLEKTFIDSNLTVTPHKSLNSCRGVISKPELLYASEGEILEGLSDQGVTQVPRITILRLNTFTY
ncbi:putative RNA-directed DNA polymerase from transposon X-element [Trichonephila clavipes]|nr:putative RNA-directed DNA polymerase from transposon X-element [Trichonephila clavipes]